MSVFKVCIKIIRKHKASLLIYLGIFLLLALLITKMGISAQKELEGFQEERPKYTIINEDKDSVYIQGFLEYMEKKGTSVSMKNEKKALQDGIFYHKMEAVLFIPKGFVRAFEENRPMKLEMAAAPRSTKSYYIQSLAESYWNLAGQYKRVFPEKNEQEITQSVLESLEAEAQTEEFYMDAGGKIPDTCKSFYMVLPYILLALSILCISTIMLTFQRNELRMRIKCAAPRTLQDGIQKVLASMAMMAVFLFALLAFSELVYAKEFSEISLWRRALLWGNSFFFTLTAMSLAVLVSHFIKNYSVQNAAANFFSLALSFLGGAFVSVDMMGEQVKALARLTPVYWYEENAARIEGMAELGGSSLKAIIEGWGLQLLFAAAFLSAALLVGKYKSQGEASYETKKTQVAR